MSVISALIKETSENPLKLFPLCEGTMRNARLGEAQAGIKIARRNINTSDMQMTPPLRQKAKKNQRAF